MHRAFDGCDLLYGNIVKGFQWIRDPRSLQIFAPGTKGAR